MIPLLQEKYHLLIPALPGYDFENDSDFTSVEQIGSVQEVTEIYMPYMGAPWVVPLH